MVNERKTENIVRQLLVANGYTSDDNVIIEEQSSDNPRIDNLLSSASKSGGKGKGYPEFIISFKDNPDNIIIIECKASTSKHESENRKKYKDYAVDGALLYAAHLKDVFTVVAIAVSGENEKEIKISNFIWTKGKFVFKDTGDQEILTYKSLLKLIKKQLAPIREEELIKKAIEYNKQFHSYSIPEVERCTLISAILVALQDAAFVDSFKGHHKHFDDEEYNPNQDLIKSLLQACGSVLGRNKLEDQKSEIILREYNKIRQIQKFTSRKVRATKKDTIETKNTILRDLINDLNENIMPFVNANEFDVLGQFYTQFIRYAGSDSQTGLVLTPSHITDLFCNLGEITKDDIVFDPCCGTGSFLVSAMKHMIELSGNNEDKHKNIKSNQLIGIEQRADMFSHACSNMMMRGDGKSHIHIGDCFDSTLKQKIKKCNPTKAFLNPPYDVGEEGQLKFIENALECLTTGGVCVAICQMSVALNIQKKASSIKERLLKKHTLKAVLSMPDELFYPVGVITCILIFDAHKPHPKNKETYFGYYKNDGFMKIKHKGRIDLYNEWGKKKNKWLLNYKNSISEDGMSVNKIVTAKDEWCAEAYMKTDFNKLNQNDFKTQIRKYLSYLFSYNKIDNILDTAIKEVSYDLEINKWKVFTYREFFEYKRGKRLIKNDRESGNVPYFSASEFNNGCTDMIGDPIFKESASIIYTTFGDCYYVDEMFTASDEISIFQKDCLNIFSGLFISTVMTKNKYKYNFGRKAFKSRLLFDTIMLPVDKNGNPDWKFMENYIKSLPYSINFQQS